MAGDYENNGRASRPSFIEGMQAMKGTNKPPASRVDLLAARYAAGLDLWTGLSLKPSCVEVIPIDDDEEDD